MHASHRLKLSIKLSVWIISTPDESNSLLRYIMPQHVDNLAPCIRAGNRRSDFFTTIREEYRPLGVLRDVDRRPVKVRSRKTLLLRGGTRNRRKVLPARKPRSRQWIHQRLGPTIVKDQAQPTPKYIHIYTSCHGGADFPH